MSAGLIGGFGSPAAAAGAAGVGGAGGGGQANRLSDLASGDFLKIMMSELTNQDPFEPNDSSAILEQLGSLRNIESQLSLQEKLEALVLQNSISQAGGLIGKVVEGLDEGNRDVSGEVTAVRIVDGKAQLELDSGQTLALERVTSIVSN